MVFNPSHTQVFSKTSEPVSKAAVPQRRGSGVMSVLSSAKKESIDQKDGSAREKKEHDFVWLLAGSGVWGAGRCQSKSLLRPFEHSVLTGKPSVKP